MPKDFKQQDMTPYLRVLVKLAQERNLLALESLSELRDIHELLKGQATFEEQQEQTDFLQKIAAAESTPPPAVPGPLKRAVLIFGVSK